MEFNNQLQKHLLVGLPSTGKTTYLAALWDTVESRVSDQTLWLKKLTDGNTEYLNNIRNKWQKCEEFPRTHLTGGQLVTMLLEDPASHCETELIIPDLPGEEYRDQWEQRIITKEYKQLLLDACGIMVFIRPGILPEDHQIDDHVDDLIRIINEKPVVNDTTSDIEPIEEHKEEIEWEPKLAKEQVKIVELIQIIT
jgi:hypothetical protein